jgi:hypothetical protein
MGRSTGSDDELESLFVNKVIFTNDPHVLYNHTHNSNSATNEVTFISIYTGLPRLRGNE